MIDYTEVHVSNRNLAWRQALEDVLWEWVSRQKAYVQWADGKDLPYWYNERTNIGFLSAATWSQGHVSLEEFIAPKGGKQDRWKGRGDLYLGLGDSEVYVEAKNTWPKVTPKDDGLAVLTERANKRLDNALEDVRATNKGRKNVKRLGLVFCSPRVTAAKASRYDEIRERLIAALPQLMTSEIREVDFWGAYFPAAARELDDGVRGDYYPGVIVAGRTAKW